MKVADIIIPTYKPDDRFLELIKRLQNQGDSLGKIIIINTQRESWKYTEIEKFENVEVHHIEKEEFDHGGTRNLGTKYSNSDYFICMTQDAMPMPKDRHLIDKLLESMSEEVKLSYARQIPYKSAGLIEKFTRIYNYGDKTFIKAETDREKFGIKLYFASNVCACYERETFEKLGGFRENLILNEDMLYAHDLLKLGMKICYNADALVYHSHNYTGLQQFRRNFDIGVSQTDFAEVFEGLKNETEGIKLVKKTRDYILKRKAFWLLPKLIYISACKYLGFRLGKAYKKLPLFCIMFSTSNKMFWEKRQVKYGASKQKG